MQQRESWRRGRQWPRAGRAGSVTGRGADGCMKCELLGAGGGAAGWALGSGKEVEGGAVLSTPKRI